jgi:FtsZ-interacting cell division protein YlmF
MSRKIKIKLEEEAFIEILVADTDLESGAEASDVEDYFEEEEEEEAEEEEQQQQQQASAEAAITNTGQQNHQPNCTALCVLLTAKERVQRVSSADVV